MKQMLFFTILFSLVLSSCSIERRLYTKGFFVQRNSVYLSDRSDLNKEESKESSLVASVSTDYTIADDKNPKIAILLGDNTATISDVQPKVNNNIDNIREKLKNENCDLITTKKGDEIECVVKEISSTEIKYLKCNNPNSPIISIRKSDVLFIKYASGEKEVINSSSSSDPVSEQLTPSNGGKSQLVAFLLCWFLGGIGIHRFYLGHIGMGILYLLTAGLCGIGWLIDFILILTGSLKPKDGEYEKTF